MLKRDLTAGRVWVAVVLAGACAESPPIEPLTRDEPASLFGGRPRDPGAFTGTLDHEFVRIAREIPGFGGLFYDETGTLNVVMASAHASMRTGDLEQRLATHLRAMGQPPRATRGLRVREARYDFTQLFAMRQRVDQVVWSLPGVVYTDADEAANRVAVAVEDAAVLASVERAIARLGIPRDAVYVHETAPLRLRTRADVALPQSGHTLQDRVRPVAGGLALRSSAPFFGICPLGVNVRSPQAPNVHGFLTHSFCTVQPHGTGPVGTSFWQPDPQVPESLIGMEARDAPPFTGGACPPSGIPDWLGCRWSVAAGGRYAAGVPNAFGRIYRTTGVETRSLEIDPDRPAFEIVDELPFSVLGQKVHKVGAHTGWTQGTVDLTCANVWHGWSSPAGSGTVTILCNDRASAASGFLLDEGGPVFVRAGEGEVRLLGLVSFGFETHVYYSPMGQIRLENPPPPGHSWRTH